MHKTFFLALTLCACSDSTNEGTVDAPVVFDARTFDARTGDAAVPDSPQPDGGLSSLTCEQLGQMALPLINALDKSCDADTDCEIVNMPVHADCSHACLLTGNDRAARKGWSNSDLTALRDEFLRRCDTPGGPFGISCIADWAPPGVTCSNHTCLPVNHSCIEQRPDAGP